MSIRLKKFWGCCLAVGSLSRGVVLNVLGVGGLWAVKTVAETYRDENLTPAFQPIYFCGIGFLSIWQIADWTLWSRAAYDKQRRKMEEDEEHEVDFSLLARQYPLHYFYSLTCSRELYLERHENLAFQGSEPSLRLEII